MSEETSRKIILRSNHSNQQQVIAAVQDHHYSNQSMYETQTVPPPSVDLELYCEGDTKFSELLEMQDEIVQHISCVKDLFIMNNSSYSNNSNELGACFDLLVRCIHAGSIKNFVFHDFASTPSFISIERANQFANALRLRLNAKNGSNIERFQFAHFHIHPDAFRIISSALFETGIKDVSFVDIKSRSFLDNNNNIISPINFWNLPKNTTLKTLTLSIRSSSLTYYTDLIDALKENKILETISFIIVEKAVNTVVPLFKKMMCTNISLLEIRLYSDSHLLYDEGICIETELNRRWKRLITKRKEKADSAAINNNNKIGNGNIIATTATAVVVADTIEKGKETENEKKTFEMRTLFTFMDKPEIRDSLIYLFLEENNNILDMDHIQDCLFD